MKGLIRFYIFTAAALATVPAVSATDYLNRTLPERWTYQPQHEPLPPGDDDWWKRFDDRLLDSLITVATADGFNILEAAHRRELARISVQQARSGYWPTVSAVASYSRDHLGGETTDSYSLGAQMSWEIDVFGKIGASVKAKKAQYRASKAEYAAAMVSIAAEMATYYIKYRVLQAEIAIAEEHMASQEKVVRIAEARHEAGLVSKLDVSQAKTVYLTTLATLPQLQASLHSTLTAMATLIGVYPDSIAGQLETKRPLPAHEMLVAAGVPADLLRRRPDIIAAEAQLAADAAAIGIAKKAFLPTLSLQGEIGTMTPDHKKIFGHGTLHYLIAPTLSWTIFDGMSRRYGTAQAKEQMALSIDAYNLTVMNAVGEVNNAMANYRAAVEMLDADTRLYEQTSESLSLSVDQYKEGLSAFSNVVDAQIDMLNAANSMATSKGNALLALIDLYRALGGSPNQ